MAEIYSEAGFKGHVIDRINFSEKVSTKPRKDPGKNQEKACQHRKLIIFVECTAS